MVLSLLALSPGHAALSFPRPRNALDGALDPCDQQVVTCAGVVRRQREVVGGIVLPEGAVGQTESCPQQADIAQGAVQGIVFFTPLGIAQHYSGIGLEGVDLGENIRRQALYAVKRVDHFRLALSLDTVLYPVARF